MKRWPHAPCHSFEAGETFMVTAGTYGKLPLFSASERWEVLHDTLLDVAVELGWDLHAWAVLNNHYHFVAVAPDKGGSLPAFISKLHGRTAQLVNKMDRAPGRKVWFQYWDTRLTHQRSYLARLQYVHTNPVYHRVVPEATQYPWCSARWFEQTASRSLYEVVSGFKTDRVNVPDDF